MDVIDRESFVELVNSLHIAERRDASYDKLIKLFKSKDKSLTLLLMQDHDINQHMLSSDLINLLINLPQITSNIYQLLNDEIFKTNNYYNRLCSIIYETLKLVHANLSKGQNQNLSLVTQLIGQICFNRHEQIYWSKIGQNVLNNSVDDLIWRKIGRRLIKQQNSLYLEPLVRLLLINATNYEQVEWFVGGELSAKITNDEDNHSQKSSMKHLLTNKFLLINYYPPFQCQNLIENIVGYLINYDPELCRQTLSNVLSVWSNASLVRHQLKDQHYYLCRILICFLRHMIHLKFKLDTKQFLPIILHSAETHLKMVELDKRNCGLFVVERLANYLNSENDNKLDFEIKFDDEKIKYLAGVLKEKSDKENGKEVEKNETEANGNEHHYDYEIPENYEDDLLPYDMSNDTPFIKTKKPIYLKDCLEGLMDTEDIEYKQTCLECVPDLIEKNKPQAKELNVDFIRVLLFLDNEEENLKEIRFKSMVKFCNLDPTKSAQYLTSQVYDQNLSIVRKLEVLDMIVQSAKELSSLDKRISIEEDHNKIKSIQNIVKNQKPEYEKIIEERLKSKTKYLCPTSSSITHKLPAITKNEFVQHVNGYFYPLINNHDKKEVSLKFNEDDYFVLGQLILTLAELLKTRKMAIALIDFTNAYKSHPESYVRKSITLAIHSILTNVPNFFLFEDLQADLFAFRDFLISLKQFDPETFHSHGVLTLYTLEEQLNDYQKRTKPSNQKKIQI